MFGLVPWPLCIATKKHKCTVHTHTHWRKLIINNYIRCADADDTRTNKLELQFYTERCVCVRETKQCARIMPPYICAEGAQHSTCDSLLGCSYTSDSFNCVYIHLYYFEYQFTETTTTEWLLHSAIVVCIATALYDHICICRKMLLRLANKWINSLSTYWFMN